MMISLLRRGIPTGAMTDMKNPHHPARFIYLREDAVNSVAFAKQQAANLSLGFRGFTRHWATVGKLFEGI